MDEFYGALLSGDVPVSHEFSLRPPLPSGVVLVIRANPWYRNPSGGRTPRADTERLCRLMGIDDSTERVGWLRYHLLLALAYLCGFIMGFREVWFKKK